MRVCFKRTLSIVFILCSVQLIAQDLAPRAYIITPIHSNALTLAYTFNSGNLIFDGETPISDARANVGVSVFNFHGTVMGNETNVYRSGLLASAFRFSVNLKGGPAMDLRDFIKWQQKTLVGVSLKVVTPSGQYDPTKLINYGANRWAFKPELGVSQRWRHWLLDTYGAVWFFTTNDEFFSRNQYNPGVTAQSQAPVGAFEGHLSYDVKPRFWASLDGNFWFGGRTSLNGIQDINTLQRNSRIGGTVSLPASRRQSLKFSYSNGAYIRYGGNYQTISLGWQYSWLGRPK